MFNLSLSSVWFRVDGRVLLEEPWEKVESELVEKVGTNCNKGLIGLLLELILSDVEVALCNF